MALANKAIVAQLTSKCSATGLFREVNGHEPKNAPEHGLTAAVWVDSFEPFAAASGLASTTAILTFMIRLYTDMLQEPQDLIDPTLTAAADQLITDISADYTLGGNVRNVDLLGETGRFLGAQAGYVNVAGVHFRIIDISVPCIVNDAWPQAK